MANRPKSIYLTDRSMSSLRPDDSLSGRMNAIVDRYLEAVARDRVRVRAMFNRAEWFTLVRLLDSLPANLAADLTIRKLEAVAGSLHAMNGGDSMVLIELLENELWGDPPATHS